MKCEDLQFSLPLFADDDLPANEKSSLEAHLASCPVCRAKHAEYVSLANSLRSLSAPPVPENLVYAVRSVVAAEISHPQSRAVSYFSEGFREWLQYRLMPYGVGTFASLLFVFIFLSAIVSTKNATDKISEVALLNATPTVILSEASSPNYSPYQDLNLSGADVAAMRTLVSMESPSLNPKGALVNLAKSFVGGKMPDEEVVVVADVFSNGLAQISQVVEAPRNRKSLEQLEKALQNDPTYAPFVPANLDNRSDYMRVVFKIQRVDVTDDEKPVRKSAKYSTARNKL